MFNNKPEQSKVSCNGFKAFLNNKIEGGFNCGVHPKLLEQAIQNSETNHSEIANPPQPDLYCTQVFHLGKSILPFVKDKL